MDDMHVTTRRFDEKARPEPLDSPLGPTACPGEATWAPKQLQDLLDEVVAPPTLTERLENWGSD